MTELDLRYQSSKDVTKSTILGFFIGLAVIVPGISGSTMASLFKLYDKLLYAVEIYLKASSFVFYFTSYRDRSNFRLCVRIFYNTKTFNYTPLCHNGILWWTYDRSLSSNHK